MIDLHHHFDGAFETEALYCEAKRRNLPQAKLSLADFTERCRVSPQCRSLTEFLDVFNFFYDIAQNVDFLHAQAMALPERTAKQGVIYLETRFAPHLFTGNRYSTRDITESVVSGLSKNGNTNVRLILCAMRNVPTPIIEDLIALYEEFSKRGVCGIDLAGDESRYACREYAPIFARAHEQGIPITIHAGEAAGPSSVYDALDLFRARRIGHGIRSIEDAALIKRLVADKIGLEVCLTSNLQTGNARSYTEHPFRRLFDAGVKVTVNTDDPAVSNIDLMHEWRVASRELKLDRADEKALLLNSIEVAFCDDTTKQVLREKIEAEFAPYNTPFYSKIDEK